MQRAPCASNGPNHLGLCALQANKVCSPTTLQVPCMVKMLATKESREKENVWKTAEGYDDASAAADDAELDGTGKSEKHWYSWLQFWK